MKKKIIWLFYLLFAICFTFTAINIILHNTYYKALHLICVTTICLVGLTIIYKNLSKNEKFIEKNYNKILISFGIGMFIIEIVLGIALRYDPLARYIKVLLNGLKQGRLKIIMNISIDFLTILRQWHFCIYFSKLHQYLELKTILRFLS